MVYGKQNIQEQKILYGPKKTVSKHLKMNIATRRWTVNGNFRFIDAFFALILNNTVPTTQTVAQIDEMNLANLHTSPNA